MRLELISIDIHLPLLSDPGFVNGRFFGYRSLLFYNFRLAQSISDSFNNSQNTMSDTKINVVIVKTRSNNINIFQERQNTKKTVNNLN